MMPESQSDPEKLSQSQQVLRVLRKRIVRGEFEPGQRLPSFGKLESELGVGRTVLQQAISTLKDDGFITSQPRQGLYIAQSPPHMGRYAIVFPCLPDHRQWSGFHGATIAQARQIANEQSDIRFEHYRGVNDERRGGVVLESLLTEVRGQRLAGLILLPETHDLAGHPCVMESGIPLIMVDGDRGLTPRPQICLDIPMLLDRSLAWLRQQGRKRIAMVYMADTFPWLTPEHFQRNDTIYRKAWVQRIGRSHPQTVSEVMHLLMDYPPSRRPDGLFIADDNLIQTSIAALLEMGL
jgi:biotin operon repressor